MMVRKDLMAMSEEDLIAYTNRGQVKRALKDLGGDDPPVVQWRLDEHGHIEAHWSDGITVTIEAEATFEQARCTCPAPGLCRHMVRTIFSYQRQHQQHPERQHALPWDPGDISDQQLAQHFDARLLKKAKKEYDAGLLLELVRGVKPMVYFHGVALTLRFLVKGDPRYSQCDGKGACSDVAVPIAVWAFRQLAKDRDAGYISTAQITPGYPVEVIAEQNAVNEELWLHGLGGCGADFANRLHQLERQLRNHAWYWPAELVHGMALEYDRYSSQDALFDPNRLLRQAGELWVRTQAIQNYTGAVPHGLILGSKQDRGQELKTTRLIALGGMIQTLRRGVSLRVYLQNADSNALMVYQQSIAEDQHAITSYAQLARRLRIKDTHLQALGASQLLLAGAKRSAQAELTPGRKAAVNPQAYEWQNLAEPVRVDDFGELQQRLALLPPSALRPLSAAENFHVLTIKQTVDGGFHQASQTIQSGLLDEFDNRITLIQPYIGRNTAGCEALLALLASQAPIRYISGKVRLTPNGLTVTPAALVYESDGERHCFQPWLDEELAGLKVETERREPDREAREIEEQDPILLWLQMVEKELAEVLMLGLARADNRQCRRWQELARYGNSLGLVKINHLVQRCYEALAQKQHRMHWEGKAYLADFEKLGGWLRLGPGIVNQVSFR